MSLSPRARKCVRYPVTDPQPALAIVGLSRGWPFATTPTSRCSCAISAAADGPFACRRSAIRVAAMSCMPDGRSATSPSRCGPRHRVGRVQWRTTMSRPSKPAIVASRSRADPVARRRTSQRTAVVDALGWHCSKVAALPANLAQRVARHAVKSSARVAQSVGPCGAASGIELACRHLTSSNGPIAFVGE